MTLWTCRQARLQDAAEIRALQARSVLELGQGFYSALEIEAFIREADAENRALIATGCYYVAVNGDALGGCGGWSLQPPNPDGAGSDERGCAKRGWTETPYIRMVFVDPRWTRQAVGRTLMAHIETAIRRAGYGRVALSAMLSGVPFYRALSYRKTGNGVVTFPEDLALPSIEMAKDFCGTAAVARDSSAT